MKYYIVGAGIWGSTIANSIATVLKQPVTIIEKRNHIGGNCYSSYDQNTGIECHRYGSHIFHTSLQQVWEYISQFAEFTSYQHKVFINYQGKVYTMPINLNTINAFYGKNFSPTEAEAFLLAEIKRDFIANPQNLEEKAISLIGRPLYEAFIKGYTYKQWGHDPKELPSAIINRLPFRTNFNANYFNDRWQGVPKDGYFSLFQRMLDNPLITVKLNTEYAAIKASLPSDATVFYTGIPDQFFDYKYGELEWRSLRFEWETVDVRDYQGSSVMNYADLDVPYTRIHEFKHYHPERKESFNCNKTVICREYPMSYQRGAEAYYSINDERNNALYSRYVEEAVKSPNLILGGRLGAYKYWDMDKAVADALHTFETKILPARVEL